MIAAQSPSDKDLEPTPSSAGADEVKVVEDLIVEMMREHPLGLGAVDVFCLGSGKPSRRAASFLYALTGYRTKLGHSPLREIVLLVSPSQTLLTENRQEITDVLTQWAGQVTYGGKEPPTPVKFRFEIAPDNRSDSVVAFVAGAAEDTVVIVSDASTYRALDVKSMDAPSGVTLPRMEDFWVPQIHHLALELDKVISGRSLYVILDTGHLLPIRQESQTLLQSLPTSAVFGLTEGAESEAAELERSARWAAAVEAGRLGELFKSIAASTSMTREDKEFARIQVLHMSGMFANALEALEQFLKLGVKRATDASIKMAKIAQDGGATLLATDLLRGSYRQESSKEMLSMALDIAEKLDSVDLASHVLARFSELYPGSDEVKKYAVRVALRSGHYADAFETVNGDPRFIELSAMAGFLLEKLGSSGMPDYLAIQQELQSKNPIWRRAASLSLVKDALRRNLPLHAFGLLENFPAEFGPHVKVDALERLISDKTLMQDTRYHDHIQLLVLQLASYLAQNMDAEIRTRCTRALSISVSGSLGMPVLIKTALDLAGKPIALQKKNLIDEKEDLSLEEVWQRKEMFVPIFHWAEQQGGLLIGRTKIPLELLPPDAAQMAPGIGKLLPRLVADCSSDDDFENSVMPWLFIASTFAGERSDHLDIELMRQTAGQLATIGRVQAARDLVEQAFGQRNRTDTGRRATWLCVADVYHRLKNPLDSLFALVVALSGTTRISLDQACYETDLLLRHCRDLRLFPQARRVLEGAERLLHHLGAFEANANRHEYLRLSIDMAEILARESGQRTGLVTLLPRILKNAQNVLGANDDPAPITMMLGQVMQAIEQIDYALKAEASAVLAQLKIQGRAGFSPLITAMTSDKLTGDSLFGLYKATQTARYATDVAFDATPLFVAARRLLSVPDLSAVEAAFAIEMSTDRAVATAGWESTAKPQPAIEKISDPADQAIALSRDGLDVVLHAFDTKNRLVQVSAVAGRLTVLCEPADHFSRTALAKWNKDYPYAYGLSPPANAFYTTTETLKLSSIPPGQFVYVPSTEAQSFPPNLFRTGETLVGYEQPIATVPSLSWLEAAKSRRNTIGTARKAWISNDGYQGHTLAMVTARLSDTFLEHAIQLNQSHAIPLNFANSELVVITAHGSLTYDKNYFQTIHDEGSLSALSEDLASALRNVGVVILFVCSGGRADRDPYGITTVGLAKQILHNGCSAVVASPWPIDSQLTAHWLPAFMDLWSKGKPLIEAVYAGNKAVARSYNSDPEHALAMMLFGDPLLRTLQ
ncbi:MAG TPA: CHAT domain-containing protein [Solimonas sp.]